MGCSPRFAAPGLLMAAVLLVACGPERVVYRGGPILTMDGESRVVEALGIEGQRIAAVGSETDVYTWAGDRSRIVDLGGRALLPGFIDAHGHFPGAGVFAVVADLNSPPIGGVENMAQLVERLRERAADTDSGDWILGMGYDDTLLAEGRHPTRADLDLVSTEHPIAIIHISGHLGSVNSRALEELGIGAGTPDPEGGIIRRTPGGSVPNGVLEETALDPIQARLTDPSLWDALSMLREAVRRYLEAGVTTAQSGYADAGQLEALRWASLLGQVPLRLVVWPSMDVADDMLSGDFSIESHDDEWFRVGAVKLVADGSIQGYTGYLSRPYHVPPGDDPEYRGYPRILRDDLIERVARYHAAGFQLAIHGNGDASIEDILDAIEGAQAKQPRADARPILIHAQMARPDQLDRMKALSVIPSFFSLHTYYWGDRHMDLFMGPVRAARMSPARSALARGIRFTIHCDAPVVPMEPLRLVWSAVNRRSASGRSIGAGERIAPMQALRAVTIDAAFQHFEEDYKGSLEPGKLADLVILSKSPLEDPAHIDEIRVLETIVGGETVYRREETP